jgi:hypothetical protein
MRREASSSLDAGKSAGEGQTVKRPTMRGFDIVIDSVKAADNDMPCRPAL